jgi:hypothetical protein
MIVKEISKENNLHYGGYRMYWKLYRQLLYKLRNKQSVTWAVKGTFTDTINLSIQENNRKINTSFFWLTVNAYTWLFIWSCIIKPLGQFFSKKIIIAGTYKIIDNKFNNVSVVKATQYKLFGFPIWYDTDQRLTEEDINELMEK